jgi:hypothetical protein
LLDLTEFKKGREYTLLEATKKFGGYMEVFLNEKGSGEIP